MRLSSRNFLKSSGSLANNVAQGVVILILALAVLGVAAIILGFIWRAVKWVWGL